VKADRSRELFHRLCEIGNDLEELRGTTFHQGMMWLRLDEILHMLDLSIDTLAPPTPEGGGSARAAARGEEEA